MKTSVDALFWRFIPSK